jgi:hypothetical protein
MKKENEQISKTILKQNVSQSMVPGLRIEKPLHDASIELNGQNLLIGPCHSQSYLNSLGTYKTGY